MHIWGNLRDFLYYKNNFIAIYDNNIYLYNFDKLITLTADKVILTMANKRIMILGTSLHALKCNNREIILNGSIKEIKYSE